MTTHQITKCDFCAASKGPGNHWFSVWIIPGGTHFVIVSYEMEHKQDGALDACGETCVGRAVHRFLATGKLELEDAAPR